MIPVRPAGPSEILGQRRVASLAEIEERIDLVDVFRRSEFCAGVARQSAAVGAGALCGSSSASSPPRRAIAGAGLDYVEDECSDRPPAARLGERTIGVPDSNRGRRRPERRALPGCAHPERH